MIVSVSTECFPEMTLAKSMERLAELEYTAVEIDVHEHGGHLQPARVAADPDLAIRECSDLQRLRPVAVSFVAAESPTATAAATIGVISSADEVPRQHQPGVQWCLAVEAVSESPGGGHTSTSTWSSPTSSVQPLMSIRDESLHSRHEMPSCTCSPPPTECGRTEEVNSVEKHLIMVDSGAARHVCPPTHGAHLGARGTSEPLRLVGASGEQIHQHGERYHYLQPGRASVRSRLQGCRRTSANPLDISGGGSRQLVGVHAQWQLLDSWDCQGGGVRRDPAGEAE